MKSKAEDWNSIRMNYYVLHQSDTGKLHSKLKFVGQGSRVYENNCNMVHIQDKWRNLNMDSSGARRPDRRGSDRVRRSGPAQKKLYKNKKENEIIRSQIVCCHPAALHNSREQLFDFCMRTAGEPAKAEAAGAAGRI